MKNCEIARTPIVGTLRYHAIPHALHGVGPAVMADTERCAT